MKKPFIVVLGKPGSGKSVVLRRAFAEVRDKAAFLDGDHDFDQMMQIVHESGFKTASYFYCPNPQELPEIIEEREEPIIFVDTPRLTPKIVEKIADAANGRKVVIAASSLNEEVPSELEKFASSVINLRENREETSSAIIEALESVQCLPKIHLGGFFYIDLVDAHTLKE